jgi:hypothetical protein
MGLCGRFHFKPKLKALEPHRKKEINVELLLGHHKKKKGDTLS